MFTIDTTRWDAITSLPVRKSIGDLTKGLCAIARIVYASTGRVSDQADADCIAPTIREYIISLNDHLPRELRQRLGTLELAQRVLAADTSHEAEIRRAYLCADTAVRVFAAGALRGAGLLSEANKLAALAPITNQDSTHATRYAAHAAANAAARTALYVAHVAAARNAADAARNAALCASYAAANVARCVAYDVHAARYAARAAANAAYAAAAWEPAFELLTALVS